MVIGLLVAGLVVTGVEIVSRHFLQKANKQVKPLLFSSSGWTQQLPSYQQNWGDELVVSYLDPHLGFAHNPAKHPLLHGTSGFVSYGDERRSESGLKLVALGGSTTDPLTGIYLEDPEVDFADPQNWPKALGEIIRESGNEAEVLNGGVAGYSSNQELIKLIRDVLPLQPDIVMCLEGVNELGFLQSVRNHPMVHPYQKKFFTQISNPRDSVVLPNTSAFIRKLFASSGRHIEGVSEGTEVAFSAAEQWERNCRIMNAIAIEHDIQFVAFLQPILGYGDYNMSSNEADMLKRKGAKYLLDVEEFYNQAREVCERNSYCIDLTNAFADEGDVYIDPRHQNVYGVEILAKAINEKLVELKYLPAAETQR